MFEIYSNFFDDFFVNLFEVVVEVVVDIVCLIGVEKYDIVFIFGSGWGKVVDIIGEIVVMVFVIEVIGFFKLVFEGYVGMLCSIWMFGGKNVFVIGVCMYYYEDYGVCWVVYSVCIVVVMGVKIMVFMNGVGGICEIWKLG